MEKRHKELLILQRANLVENLNIRDGLFTQLIAKKVLTQRMVRSIQTGRSLDEQIEALLDRLPQCGSKAFPMFCEALKEDFQEEIVELYLTPDTDTAEKDTSSSCGSVQESISASASTVSEESAGDNGQSRDENLGGTITTGAAVSCGNGVSRGNMVAPGNVASTGGVVTTGSLATPATITEEYQQQIYRRSIEPGLAESVARLGGKYGQDLNSRAGVDEHDARFLYQNITANPGLVSSSVYSFLNSPGLSLAEKERLLSEMSPSKIGAYRHGIYNTGDPLNVKDMIHSKEHLLSSPLLRSFQAEMPLHPDSPLKSQTTPFSFQTLDRPSSNVDRPSSMSERPCQNMDRLPTTIQSSPHVPRHGQEIHYSPVKHSSISQSERALELSVLSSVPQQERMYSASSAAQNHLIDRDMREIPRHIEVTVPVGAGAREMISIPRHVEIRKSSGQFSVSMSEETAQSRGQPVTACDGEMGLRGDNHNIQSLKRNDSVDTMNKRPFAEIEEPEAKRFRENIENIPTTPDKLTAMRYLGNKTNNATIIPVIEGAKLLPSQPSVVVEFDHHLELTQRGSLLGVMDDPEIDLTDGPINVKVDLCTRQFYLTYYKQAYKMRSIPRGKALIMNVNEVVGKSARRGTDIDRDNLHNLLCQLHFDVTVYNDSDGLTAKEMVLKLQDFAQSPAHKLGDCTVVCILSHGEEGYIFGADGKKFELDAVFSLFDNTCCESLRGKPKLFIIQACRGGALDRGVQYYPDEHDGSDARVRQVPSMSDMLICYPTQNGYYAWRNRDRGSWYVEALVHVFMKYAKCEDVCTMLNRVNLLVSKKVSHCPTIEMDQMSQMSEYKSTLRMPHFFFFPGIGGT